MDPQHFARLLEVFERAQELVGEERARFLEQACGADEPLLREAERMLAAAEAPEFLAPLDEPLGQALSADDAVSKGAAPTGTQIGAFRLLRRLGSGGMGVVYEAQQEHPRRRVALKMLADGFGDADLQRRFRSEVELLARLDHPAIARVLEAGVHCAPGERDRPFFAMEFVADARDLLAWGRGRPLAERLKKFAQVCDAIQHGHQQGVIHRDLKPANVLVDGDDQVKVIDFGVARAIDQDFRAATLVTQPGQIVGTLHYMAPEQLGGDAVGVDTRTDVYALGLLLYELAYGKPPFALRGKPITEIARIIREAAPARPERGDSSVPADVGWIALRALEKERARRYSSASELAADVRRFLTHRPVEAGPPSRLYATRKFVRRNRTAVAAAVTVVVALSIGGGVAFASMVRAGMEAEKFRSINDVLNEMFVSVRANEDGYDVRAAELLDRAATQLGTGFERRPEVEAPLRRTLAKSYYSLGLYEKTAEQAERALALRRVLTRAQEVDTVYHLVQALLSLDRNDEARALLTSYPAAHLARDAALRPADRLPLRQVEAQLLSRAGRSTDALAAMRTLVEDARRLLGPEAESTMHFESSLVDALLKTERNDEAEVLARALVEKSARVHGPEAAPTLVERFKLARVVARQHEHAEAIAMYEDLVPRFVTVFGEKHSRTLIISTDLANTYLDAERPADALPILEETVRIREERAGPEHSETVLAKIALAKALKQLGDGRARELFEAAFASRRSRLGPDHPGALRAQLALGRYLRQEGLTDEAEPLLRDLCERALRVFLDDDLDLHEATAELGMLLYQTAETRGHGYDMAAGLLHDAWRGYQRRVGELDEIGLVMGNNYAAILLHAGRADEAVPVLTEILVGIRAAYPEDDPMILSTLLNLAGAHKERGELGLAELRFREAAAWAETHLPAGHARRAVTTDMVATVLVAQGRHDEALPFYAAAIESADLNPEVVSADHAIYRLGYAKCLREVGRFDDALRQFAVAFEMEAARVGLGGPWFDDLRAEMAEVERERDAAAGDG